jgi:predicted ATPase
MLTLIEALNYRCLRYVSQPLQPFHVLVGPNASGKTTFLDVVAFLGRLVSDGPEAAVRDRTQNLRDLVWMRSGNSFELAIEARIPLHLREASKQRFEFVRYEVGVAEHAETGEIELISERVLLREPSGRQRAGDSRPLFPSPVDPPPSLARRGRTFRTIVSKTATGNDVYTPESEVGWHHTFKLGPRKSALGNLPEDESRFPATTWLKQVLQEGIQQIVLNSMMLRQASPPGQVRRFKTDGSNLPWVVDDLRSRFPDRFSAWMQHLKCFLENLQDITVVQRPEDGFKYIVLVYTGSLHVPSWTASDGTLRLIALTVPAYHPELPSVFVIEEPENGIHPRAIGGMIQSLSSVYGSQVLLASHSPVVLSEVEPDKILCFAKTSDGSTDICNGTDHPRLKDWKRTPTLDVLYVSGVLG